MKRRVFGSLPDGRTAEHVRLTHANGLEATCTNFGGILLGLNVPQPNGEAIDVIVGQPDWEACYRPHPSMGVIVGRYGNRIANGRFELGGKTYQLPQNHGQHTLHGGKNNFSRQLWEAVEEGETLCLKHLSPAGTESFPGNLAVEVRYSLTDEGGFRIEYQASTDAPTVLNLTHHAYFNLSGTGSILDTELQLASDQLTEVDADLIPTGKLLPVSGTPFDFTKPKPIGQDIAANDPFLTYGSGYDHNFVVREWDGNLRSIALASDPRSGIQMEVLTTEPGVQLYTANHLKNYPGKNGQLYQARTGFCLETQHFPDSPNHPHFPSTVLQPGETYRQTTEYRFPL
ncbi:MAG: aldose epimerase family protein [Bacteroidota bacterium]